MMNVHVKQSIIVKATSSVQAYMTGYFHKYNSKLQFTLAKQFPMSRHTSLAKAGQNTTGFNVHRKCLLKITTEIHNLTI
jgi:hypothetical protein